MSAPGGTAGRFEVVVVSAAPEELPRIVRQYGLRTATIINTRSFGWEVALTADTREALVSALDGPDAWDAHCDEDWREWILGEIVDHGEAGSA